MNHIINPSVRLALVIRLLPCISEKRRVAMSPRSKMRIWVRKEEAASSWRRLSTRMATTLASQRIAKAASPYWMRSMCKSKDILMRFRRGHMTHYKTKICVIKSTPRAFLGDPLFRHPRQKKTTQNSYIKYTTSALVNWLRAKLTNIQEEFKEVFVLRKMAKNRRQSLWTSLGSMTQGV